MTKITKAVIPCAGMGTRFMPVTKAVPKELLPVLDTPVLSYIVDEAIDSGVTDVLLIVNDQKQDIVRYFSPDPVLYDKLEKAGKSELVARLKAIHERAAICFAYQNEPKGSGDAVYLAKSFTGDAPFCLAWGDDLIRSQIPVMRQLIDAFEDCKAPLIGVQRLDTDDIVKYGVADVIESKGRSHLLRGIVEKPALERIPSRLASLGRYVLTKEVYGAIERTPTGRGGEYQLTDALEALCKMQAVYAYEFEGRRYDMGDKLGAMTAYTELALCHPQIGDCYREYLKKLVNTL